MKRAQKLLARISTVTAGFAPAFALAHPGHGNGDTSSFIAEALHLLGWQHALGYLFASAGLIAASVAAIRWFVRSTTAVEPRSPTWAAGAAPARRLFARR